MKAWAVLAFAGLAAALVAAADPRAQLAEARQQAEAARTRSAQLDAQSRAAIDEAEKARAAQAAVAARIQASEADIAAAEARLAILKSLQRAQEQRLAARQQPIVKLVAALQTMARRPAGAALVQPGTLTDLVHVRALLSTMAPRLATATAGLREEVMRAQALRKAADGAVAQLREGQRQGRVEQQRLVQLEMEQRRRSAQMAAASQLEAQRAASLAESANNLEELVARLGAEGSVRDRLASLPGPLPRPQHLSETLPAVTAPPAAERLVYRLPVLGPVVRGFGEALPAGGRARGVTIAARPGAIVVAPAKGRVTFAGLYRGYGAIAIVEHDDGYTSLVTGLASNSARVGDTVDAGSPLGRAGPDGVTVELRQRGQSVDLATLIG